MVKDTICKVIDILHIPDLILRLNIFVPKSVIVGLLSSLRGQRLRQRLGWLSFLSESISQKLSKVSI